MKPILEYLYNRKGAIKSIDHYGILQPHDVVILKNGNMYMVFLDQEEINMMTAQSDLDYSEFEKIMMRDSGYTRVTDYSPDTLKDSDLSAWDVKHVYRPNKNIQIGRDIHSQKELTEEFFKNIIKNSKQIL